MRTDYVHCDDVRPGCRIVVSYGIVTVRGIKIGGTSCTLYFEEPQAPLTLHRSNSVEVVRE